MEASAPPVKVNPNQRVIAPGLLSVVVLGLLLLSLIGLVGAA
jgi:hypothetical protein